MRYHILAAPLLLAACSPNWRTYEPELSEPVADRNRYVADLQACKDEVMNPKPGEQMMFGLFGLAGAAAVAVDKPGAFAPPNDQVDWCMGRKGYKLAAKP